MDPKDKRSCIQALVYLLALTSPLLILGLILTGGSIHYLDCDRTPGTVNCTITTRFLGTFITENRIAVGVINATEALDCEEDSCMYRVELTTTTGMEPLSIDYLTESNAEMVDRINTYLIDFDQQAFHIKVVYQRMFFLSAVFIFIGGVGALLALFLGIYLRRVKKELGDLILAPKADGTAWLYSQANAGPPPEPLQMDREITRLLFRYRHPAKTGLAWLLLGTFLLGLGWIKEEPIAFWILTPFGLLLLYLALVALVNQWTIQVTHYELLVRFAPIPFYYRRRRIPSRDIKQLYVEPRTILTKQGKQTYYVLEAILQNNRQIFLMAELPYHVLHYIELQIESWLKLEDRWVTGEAVSEPLEDAIKE